MEKIRHIERLVLRQRRVPALVIALALTVLAGVVALTTLQMRHRIREQIAGRDGELLHAVALMYYEEDVKSGLADSLTDAGAQLSSVLRSAELRGVLGVRLFDTDGRFVDSFPVTVMEDRLDENRLRALRNLHPVNHFHPRMEVARVFYLDQERDLTNTIPLLEVNVPLHTENGPLAGVAQFLIEGHSIAVEFARLDKHLAMQASVAFAAGGAILTGALAWAFRRLRRAQMLLAERTENLLRANQELALAAKTSALGAVTAHLLHGLKNPLAGLQTFVASHGTSLDGDEEADWQQAVASTRRMQVMIEQVVGVLREEQAGAGYDLTLAELEGIVRNRVQPLARDHGVNFTSVVPAEGALPNRVANLVALVLVNLAENAVQATPPGKAVVLRVTRNEAHFLFEVRDEGAGFPADTPLFMPCRSTREGGTGIGLALCKQLANHLGAELELAASTPGGCVFVLKLSAAAARPESASATGAQRTSPEAQRL